MAEERNEEKVEKRSIMQQKQLMLDRLAILNNISIRSNKNNSPTIIKDIWSAYDNIVHTVKQH